MNYVFDPNLSSVVATTEPAPPPPKAEGPLSPELLDKMLRYWQAANYLTVGQIYLQANPLLREPLTPDQIKPRLLGHWGTSPGLNLIYVQLNRLIKERDVDAIYLTGPGHGGPAIVAQVYLEGTYSEIYPSISEDEPGMRALFRQFSTPGGIPSHVSVPTPGSIHEGGELGYVLSHAFGAAFDNPDLVVAAVIGDGEAETGPLAGGWQGVSFLNPARDGAVLPILHLNGYKIAGPTVMGRMSDDDVRALIGGHGYEVRFRLRRRSWRGLPGLRGHAGLGARHDQSYSNRGPHQRVPGAAALARDRAADAQGVDGTEGCRWQSHLRHPPFPSGAAFGRAPGSGASRPSWKNGCAATSLVNSSTMPASSFPSWLSWRRQATGAWAPIRMLTAASCWSI